ncbi:MAG: phospho-N-acetylmuramoyl-pentapeptide-transferase, partial [Erysipelotrichaceae bacterium]|nr:phospho-N-acetylmuramoyl-pentapeptide-transferase [Erysipelotrichaceae bacterium]
MNFVLTSVLGFVLSFIAVFVIMRPYITALKNHNINQEVSEYALDEYKVKAKTPIMGGLLFVILPVIVYLVIDMKVVHSSFIMLVVLSYLLYCLIGFADDILIILRKDNNGLSPKVKLILEFIFAAVIFFIFKDALSFQINIPFLNGGIRLRWFIFLPFIILMFLGEANAVNFTDGMDGLCAGVSFIGLLGYALLAYIYHAADLFIFICCVLGGLLAYLYYNRYPARIFMGDSGSLALGALFASLALVTDTEIALLFIGGVFLIEMFCVCLQLTSVKLFKRRVFRYTPIHYAFVLRGNKETDVVHGFYLLAAILTLIGVFVG